MFNSKKLKSLRRKLNYLLSLKVKNALLSGKWWHYKINNTLVHKKIKSSLFSIQKESCKLIWQGCTRFCTMDFKVSSSNWVAWKDPYDVLGIPEKIFIGIFQSLCLIIGTVLIMGIVSYERYGQDPQKRSLQSQVRNQVARLSQTNNDICRSLLNFLGFHWLTIGWHNLWHSGGQSLDLLTVTFSGPGVWSLMRNSSCSSLLALRFLRSSSWPLSSIRKCSPSWTISWQCFWLLQT